MGFSVPRFSLGKDRKDRAGQDYVPPETSYKPTVNVHGNHSNLDHSYDPLADLPGTFLADDNSEPERRSLAVPLAVALLVLTIAALIALPLLLR
jgi:hypothetical protein